MKTGRKDCRIFNRLAYGTILLVDGLFGVEPDLHCDYAATYVMLVASQCTFWKIPAVLV